MDIDNSADDIAVALSGEAVIYDGEGILEDAAGKDRVPKGIGIVWTTEISW